MVKPVNKCLLWDKPKVVPIIDRLEISATNPGMDE